MADPSGATLTAVIGAGISGLTVAYRLAAAGRRVSVLEAMDRPGGAIHTRTEDGFTFEAGPNSILGGAPATRALVDELGIADRLQPADPAAHKRWLFIGGRLRPVPTSPPALLRSELLSGWAKLRLLAEILAPSRSVPDESLADFARRRFGRAVLPLVDAAQSGIYAGDPTRLSAEACFPALVALEREHGSVILGQLRTRKSRSAPREGLCSFQGGLSTLVNALAGSLGDRLRLNTPVQRITPWAGGFKLVLQEGTLDADEVVLALPAPRAAELLGERFPILKKELGQIRYAPLAVVHLGFSRALLAHPPEGFGFLVPHAEGRRLLGAIFTSSLFPGRAPADAALFTCMVGGAQAEHLPAQGDEALIELAREELAAAVGPLGPPRFARVIRWPQAIPQYEQGHLQRLQRLERRLAETPGLYLLGNAFRGVGINDCIRNASELAARMGR